MNPTSGKYPRRGDVLTERDRGVQALAEQSEDEPQVCFKMCTCDYQNKDGSILIRGRMENGKSIQVRLVDFQYYFYIHRQTPFADEADIRQCLGDLERIAKANRTVRVPVQGSTTELTESRAISTWVLDSNPSIHTYRSADNVYRTMYGYTPEDEYLQGLLRVYVQDYRYVKHLANVIESEEYLDYLKQTFPGQRLALRSFGAGVSPDTLYCCNYDVRRGGFSRITSYVTDSSRIVYADAYHLTNFRNLRSIAEPKIPVALRECSFDIECVGKPDGRGGMTFPVAKSTPGIPADPVMMIAMAQRRYGVDKGLGTERAQVLVYRHPDAAPIQRLRAHERISRDVYAAYSEKQKQTMNAQYQLLDVVEYDSEAELLKAFESQFHSWRPDVVTGWNTHSFDYPYLYNRWEELYRTNSNGARDVLRTPRPCFGMSIRQASYSYMKTTSSKASGARKFQCVTLPNMMYADGMVVFENPSYGAPGLASFRLDYVASFYLKYPGTDRPQRKIKFPLAQSMAIWREGGARMWFFSCYCFVDALLPLQLLDKFDKIGLMFGISAITYCDMTKVYNNGMQVKVISIIHRAIVTYRGGIFLEPDYGLRHLHWPGLFLKADVREAIGQYRDQFRCAPEKETNYPGAKVVVPKAGYYPVPVMTDDFKSLYPTSAKNYGLSYDTMLTPEMIAHYKIPRYEYTVVPLGPRSLTYCGYPVEDAQIASDAGYNENTIMMSYWYSPRVKTFVGYIIDLLFDLRNDYKKAMWRWAVIRLVRYSLAIYPPTHPPTPLQVLSYDRDTLPDLSDTVVCGKIREKVGQGFLTAMQDAIQAGLGAWQALWDEYRSRLSVLMSVGECVEFANLSHAKADIGQLACKLTVNSFYGFTGVVIRMAILPMMMLAAATTAIGRRVLEFTKNVAERVSAQTLLEMHIHIQTVKAAKGELSAEKERKEIIKQVARHVFTMDTRRVR